MSTWICNKTSTVVEYHSVNILCKTYHLKCDASLQLVNATNLSLNFSRAIAIFSGSAYMKAWSAHHLYSSQNIGIICNITNTMIVLRHFLGLIFCAVNPYIKKMYSKRFLFWKIHNFRIPVRITYSTNSPQLLAKIWFTSNIIK